MDIYYTNAKGESILDPAGQPVRKAELTKEFAAPQLTGVRQAWHDSVSIALTPQRLANLLLDSTNGDEYDYLTLAEEMEEREPHYASVLGTRKRAAAQLPCSVEAASDDAADQRMADAVRALTDMPEFEDLLIDLMDALGKGWSAVEIVWDTRYRLDELPGGVGWGPERYEWRDPRFFQWDRVTGQHLLLRDESHPNGKQLPAFKFLIHRPKLKSGLPVRGGLARLCAFAFMCKSYDLRDWMAFAEVFGMPLRVGKYGNNASEADVSILRSAVATIGTDAAAVIPDTMRIEFEQAVNAQGGAQLFQGLADWLDKQTSKAVLGQTMTTDDGSSQSQANVHNEVRIDLRDFDAGQLCKTINKYLVRPFIYLNFGPQRRYPTVKLIEEEAEDLEPWIKAVTEIVDRGGRVESSQVLDRLGIADAAEDAETKGKLLRPKGGTAQAEPPPDKESAPALNTRQVALNRRSLSDGDLDDLVDEGLADWQVQMEPSVEAIEQLAADSADEAEFMARLPALLEEMDASPFLRKISTQAFKAFALGDGAEA